MQKWPVGTQWIKIEPFFIPLPTTFGLSLLGYIWRPHIRAQQHPTAAPLAGNWVDMLYVTEPHYYQTAWCIQPWQHYRILCKFGFNLLCKQNAFTFWINICLNYFILIFSADGVLNKKGPWALSPWKLRRALWKANTWARKALKNSGYTFMHCLSKYSSIDLISI